VNATQLIQTTSAGTLSEGHVEELSAFKTILVLKAVACNLLRVFSFFHMVSSRIALAKAR